MHDANGFVRREPWLGIRNLVSQSFLTVRYTVCKDDTDALVKIEAALGGTADVEVDEISKRWSPFIAGGALWLWKGVNDRSS